LVKLIPFFSVIMNTFEGDRFIKRAIDSILNQSFKDFELVVVVNGSTDNTIEILKEYKDCRIKVLVLDRTIDLGAAREYAIKNCAGLWVCFLDDDDELVKNALKVRAWAIKILMLFMASKSIGLHSAIHIRDNRSLKKAGLWSIGKKILLSIFIEDRLHNYFYEWSSVVIPREIIKDIEIPAKVNIISDKYIVCFASLNGVRFIPLPAALSIYFKNDSGLWFNRQDIVPKEENILRTTLMEFTNAD